MTEPINTALVTLREITSETVIPVISLSVAESQKGFVAPNSVSLAQALFSPEAWYRAIYLADELVGEAGVREGWGRWARGRLGEIRRSCGRGVLVDHAQQVTVSSAETIVLKLPGFLRSQRRTVLSGAGERPGRHS